MQFLPEKKCAYILLYIVISAAAILWNQTGIEVSNANMNVMVCMPFFLIGIFLKSMKGLLNSLHHYYMEVTLLALAVALVLLCGNYNSYVWMYLCEYGNDYALYIIGGMAGTTMLFIVSLWLSRLPYRNMIMTLSKGSIIIIGLHIILVRRLMELPNRMWIEDLLWAMIILLFFIPIVLLAERFFPILLGHHKC